MRRVADHKAGPPVPRQAVHRCQAGPRQAHRLHHRAAHQAQGSPGTGRGSARCVCIECMLAGLMPACARIATCCAGSSAGSSASGAHKLVRALAGRIGHCIWQQRLGGSDQRIISSKVQVSVLCRGCLSHGRSCARAWSQAASWTCCAGALTRAAPLCQTSPLPTRHTVRASISSSTSCFLQRNRSCMDAEGPVLRSHGPHRA